MRSFIDGHSNGLSAFEVPWRRQRLVRLYRTLLLHLALATDGLSEREARISMISQSTMNRCECCRCLELSMPLRHDCLVGTEGQRNENHQGTYPNGVTMGRSR